VSDIPPGPSRRELFRGAIGITALPVAARAGSPPEAPQPPSRQVLTTLHATGLEYRLMIDSRTSLLDALREPTAPLMD
jgi:hypothetical protein